MTRGNKPLFTGQTSTSDVATHTNTVQAGHLWTSKCDSLTKSRYG